MWLFFAGIVVGGLVPTVVVVNLVLWFDTELGRREEKIIELRARFHRTTERPPRARMPSYLQHNQN